MFDSRMNTALAATAVKSEVVMKGPEEFLKGFFFFLLGK